MRVASSELHLVEPASRETACGLPLAGLAYATPQGFEQPHRLKQCRRCSYASVVPCKGGCGKRLRWYERHADGLCWRYASAYAKPKVDERAGYTIYKNQVLRSAAIHRTWCRQAVVRAIAQPRGQGDRLVRRRPLDRQGRRHEARSEGWEVRRCGGCSP